MRIIGGGMRRLLLTMSLSACLFGHAPSRAQETFASRRVATNGVHRLPRAVAPAELAHEPEWAPPAPGGAVGESFNLVLACVELQR